MRPRRGGTAFKAVLLELRDTWKPVLHQVRMIEIPSGAEEETHKDALSRLLRGIPAARCSHIVSIVDDPFMRVHPGGVAEVSRGAGRWANFWDRYGTPKHWVPSSCGR